jgi:hypothetical protein
MRTKLEVKRIELWSLFKVAFFIYGAIGLVAGLFYGFFLLAASLLEHAFLDEGLAGFGLLGGAFSIVLIPLIALFYGVFGSVFVTIVGFLYNLFAGMVGGVRFETLVAVGEAEPVAAAEVPPHVESAEPDDQPPTI